jgi:hypothetical protein
MRRRTRRAAVDGTAAVGDPAAFYLDRLLRFRLLLREAALAGDLERAILAQRCALGAFRACAELGVRAQAEQLLWGEP